MTRTRVMLFHLAGLTSEEEFNVKSERKGIITLDMDDDPKRCYKFDTKTGKCINDDTTFGARRTLKL